MALLLFYVFDFRIDDRIELSVHENICLNNPTLAYSTVWFFGRIIFDTKYNDYSELN